MKQKRKYGGVNSSKTRTSAPNDNQVTRSAAVHTDFVYNGGPVIRSPEVYVGFWGPMWSDAVHIARAQRLSQFIRDLLNSEYMNILSQYGVGKGAGDAGRFVNSVFVADTPNQLDAQSIATVIQNCINTGTLPEPPIAGNNMVLIIYLDETLAVDEPGLRMCEPSSDNAFGFHLDFVTEAGNEFYYAVIPALNDNCIRNTCGSSDCSLSLSQTQEERLTQVTSHEFAEMCTDPKFKSGWFGATSDENGDICNGQSGTITVGTNTWNVQCQYSKTHDESSNGTRVCLVSVQSPMAKRADGPS